MISRQKYCHEWRKLLNYKTVTYIDEKPFELGCIPNRQNTRFYRAKSQKHTVPTLQIEKHSVKIHTFCCVNWHGKSEIRVYVDYKQKRRGFGLKRIHLAMNTDNTIDSFANYLLPFLDETDTKNNLILMDGARCHISKDTQDWLDENSIKCIPYGRKPIQTPNGHPPNSPDLNPIENIFAYWHERVAKRNPKMIAQLIEIVKDEWNKIPLSVIRNCIKHLSKVMKWVEENNGNYYRE